MNAKTCRLAATLVALNLASPGFAQTAKDGSRPQDGAIKGGSIAPGETAGIPTDRARSRCSDLTGTLREQCLAQEQGTSAGGTRLPEADVAKPPPTREAPPPQNPQFPN